MGIEELLRRAMADLRSAGASYALVGGHAVSARTEPRFTSDIDLAVATASDHDAESLVQQLVARGHRIRAIVEQEDTARLATVRLEHRDAPGIMIDLLFATSGIEPELVAAAEPLLIGPDLQAPVASIGHLLALKLLAVDDARRPQDTIDLGALVRVATREDLRTAEGAVDLITHRGANRERDLRAMLAALIAKHRP